MNSTLTRNNPSIYWLFFVLLLTLAVRLVFFIAVKPWDEAHVRQTVIRADDSNGYDRTAKSILESRDFGGPVRTPAYPLFLAFIYSIFGYQVRVVLFCQILLDVATAFLTYLLGKLVFQSRTVGLLAAGLYAFNFLAAAYTTKYYSENHFVFFVTLSIFSFVLALKKQKPRHYFLSGLCMGWTALIRPIFVYIPFLTVPMMLFYPSKNKLQKTLIFVFSFLMVTALWQYRNYQKYGYYSLSVIQGNNLIDYIVPMIDAYKQGKDNISSDRKISHELAGERLQNVTNPFERARISREVSVPYILENFSIFLRYHLRGVFYTFFMPPVDSVSKAFGVDYKHIEKSRLQFYGSISGRFKFLLTDFSRDYCLLKFLLLKTFVEYCLIFAGIFICFKNREQRFFTILFLLFIFYFANLATVAGSARFRIPFNPLLLVLASYGFTRCWEYYKKKKRT